MCDFTACDGPNLSGLHSCDGGCTTVESKELDLVSSAILIKMHDGADVTLDQSMLGQRRGQNYAIMFFNHNWRSGSAEYAVTRRGYVLPRSMIHTVRTKTYSPRGRLDRTFHNILDSVRRFQAL